MIKQTLLAVAALSASFALTGCGPDATQNASATTTASASAPSANASAAPGGPGGPGGNADEMAAVQKCLKDAGWDDKMPSPPGQGGQGGQPGTPPTGQPPSDGSQPGTGGPFADADVQAALKKCGLDVPQPPSGGPGGGQQGGPPPAN